MYTSTDLLLGDPFTNRSLALSIGAVALSTRIRELSESIAPSISNEYQ